MTKPVACIHPDTFELLKHGRYQDTKFVAVHRRSEVCEIESHIPLYSEQDARIDELTAEVASLRDALASIRVYANDTLSGPVKSTDDTRNWQRSAVIELRDRARNALKDS